MSLYLIHMSKGNKHCSVTTASLKLTQYSSIMKYLVNLHPLSLARSCLFALNVCVCVWPQSWMRWGLEPPSTQCLRRHAESLTLLWPYMGAAEATAEVRGHHSCTSQTMRHFCPQQRQTAQATHMNHCVLWKTTIYPTSWINRNSYSANTTDFLFITHHKQVWLKRSSLTHCNISYTYAFIHFFQISDIGRVSLIFRCFRFTSLQTVTWAIWGTCTWMFTTSEKNSP